MARRTEEQRQRGRDYMRDYRKRPHVKATRKKHQRRQLARPEVKEKARARAAELRRLAGIGRRLEALAQDDPRARDLLAAILAPEGRKKTA